MNDKQKELILPILEDIHSKILNVVEGYMSYFLRRAYLFSDKDLKFFGSAESLPLGVPSLIDLKTNERVEFIDVLPDRADIEVIFDLYYRTLVQSKFTKELIDEIKSGIEVSLKDIYSYLHKTFVIVECLINDLNIAGQLLYITSENEGDTQFNGDLVANTLYGDLIPLTQEVEQAFLAAASIMQQEENNGVF